MSDTLDALIKSLSTVEPVKKVYSTRTLTNDTQKKLLPYQIPNVVKLITILLRYSIALDSSDTGIGKTYMAIAICIELGRKPIIICPKTLIYNWLSVMEYFGIKHYDVVNYETIKNGKTYRNNKFTSRKASDHVAVIDQNLIPNGNSNQDQTYQFYKWTVPKDAIVIFDEVHRCKDPSTGNGKFLMSAKQLIYKKIPVLLLSATICEKYTDMKIPFYLFNMIANTRLYKSYIGSLKIKYPKYRVKYSRHQTKEQIQTANENAQAMIIYEEIKGLTSRIRIKDLGDQFASNQVCCQQFFAEESDEISKAYAEIAELMVKLKTDPGSNHLARIQKLKQEIEFRKVPIFIEQAQLYLDEGKSVVIFVNYLDSLRVISDQLAIRCKIYGEQTMAERQEAIELFQTNAERIIICQIRAGGVGISLHDLTGNHPRVSLMNFPDTATDLLQALGRIHRSGGKSVALQRIIFVANVDYEKVIMQNIKRKLTNLSATNDGDLNGYNYGVKKITRKVAKKS